MGDGLQGDRAEDPYRHGRDPTMEGFTLERIDRTYTRRQRPCGADALPGGSRGARRRAHHGAHQGGGSFAPVASGAHTLMKRKVLVPEAVFNSMTQGPGANPLTSTCSVRS